MKKWLKLLRWPNLIMVGLIFYLYRYGITEPVLFANGGEWGMSQLNFFLLVLASVIITGAGYMVNDYFDQDLDSMNKADKQIVGVKIDGEIVFNAYLFLTVLSLVLALIVSVQVGNWQLTLLYLIDAGLLWFYSERYKRKVFFGNFIVALIAGMSVVIPFIFEFIALTQDLTLRYVAASAFPTWVTITAAYALFALLTTLSRELIKDLEDKPGDERFGCRTLPIVYGIATSRIIILVVHILTIAFLLYVQYNAWLSGFRWLVHYLWICQILLVYVGFMIFRAEETRTFHRLSTLMKITMLIGILSMLVARFEFYHA